MLESNKSKILLVEDEPNFGSVLKDYLELNEYSVSLFADGLAGKQGYDKGKFDLILLDVMLPKMDGFTLGRYIRSRDTHIPLIFITAKTMKPDVIEGFKTGADDYITKPFDSELMLLKIKAILKRNREEIEETAGIDENFQIGGYSFNYKRRQLTIKDNSQLLSPREAELLKLLCVHINDVMLRTEALNKIWNEDNYFTTRSMDVFIARLRKFLKEDPNVEIVNIHGNGFILRVTE